MNDLVKNLRNWSSLHDGKYSSELTVQAADLIEQQQREIERLEVKLLSEEFQQVVDWKDEIKHLHERCERLNKAANDYKQERDALAAHVERFKQGVHHFNRSHGDMSPLLLALTESPKPALAEVKARQAEESFVAGNKYDSVSITDIQAAANEHANKIRINGKDGE